MPELWSLDEDESAVSQEEHESVVKHDIIEEGLPTEEKVEDVRYEETEGREAEHDGVEDSDDIGLVPGQTDVHHPAPPPVRRVRRSEAELSSPQPELLSVLVPPLREDQLHRGPCWLERDLIVAEMVREQLSLEKVEPVILSCRQSLLT